MPTAVREEQLPVRCQLAAVLVLQGVEMQRGVLASRCLTCALGIGLGADTRSRGFWPSDTAAKLKRSLIPNPTSRPQASSSQNTPGRTSPHPDMDGQYCSITPLPKLPSMYDAHARTDARERERDAGARLLNRYEERYVCLNYYYCDYWFS